MITRRKLLFGGGAMAIAGGFAFAFRRRLGAKLKSWTRSSEFAATPALVPHDPAKEKRTIYVAKGGTVEANMDKVLDGAGLDKLIAPTDIVLIKISAQWWNQGMTNAAAAKRTIERVLAVPGFAGEVIVFENTHFRDKAGSGLTRAFTRPSDRNVDVPGWTSLGDLRTHFAGKPVGFVGLVDAAPSELANDGWHDPDHAHGVYGGDGRGPIEPGELRDGMRWDFAREFAKKRGWFESAKTPLTWPVFTSPTSGLQIDLAEGAFEIGGGARKPRPDRAVKWISLVTANEHSATGMTCCCKSAMGIVDMSAGKLGTDPRTAGYNSIHYFGTPDAQWRMAGPLAHFAKHVRTPDLYVAVAEWVALSPPASNTTWDDDGMDVRLEAATAHRANTVVAGSDPVAIDFHVAKHVLTPIAEQVGARTRAQFDVRDPDSKLSKFLRYYREVWGQGTLDEALVTVSG